MRRGALSAVLGVWGAFAHAGAQGRTGAPPVPLAAIPAIYDGLHGEMPLMSGSLSRVANNLFLPPGLPSVDRGEIGKAAQALPEGWTLFDLDRHIDELKRENAADLEISPLSELSRQSHRVAAIHFEEGATWSERLGSRMKKARALAYGLVENWKKGITDREEISAAAKSIPEVMRNIHYLDPANHVFVADVFTAAGAIGALESRAEAPREPVRVNDLIDLMMGGRADDARGAVRENGATRSVPWRDGPLPPQWAPRLEPADLIPKRMEDEELLDMPLTLEAWGSDGSGIHEGDRLMRPWGPEGPTEGSLTFRELIERPDFLFKSKKDGSLRWFWGKKTTPLIEVPGMRTDAELVYRSSVLEGNNLDIIELRISRRGAPGRLAVIRYWDSETEDYVGVSLRAMSETPDHPLSQTEIARISDKKLNLRVVNVESNLARLRPVRPGHALVNPVGTKDEGVTLGSLVRSMRWRVASPDMPSHVYWDEHWREMRETRISASRQRIEFEFEAKSPDQSHADLIVELNPISLEVRRMTLQYHADGQTIYKIVFDNDSAGTSPTEK